LSRDQLLRALVNPSARIAPGYGLVTLTFDDGSRVTGTLMEEDDQFVVVKSGESEPVKMAKADIAERQNAPSSMPSMGAILDKRELRDIVEFLAGLQ
jgi:putative heme-binding domain-containing protein